jgi:hypothetical protein
METKVVFEEKVSLSPTDINRMQSSSIDELLLKKFAKTNEGQCSVHGWLIPGSLKILARSIPQIEGGRFTGDLVSWVQIEGSVIYPVDGARLKGLVLKKNKMGLFVMYENAIQIIIPRDLHIGNEEFDSVQINDMIEVEIKKSRFQVKDQYILSVGLFISKVARAAVAITSDTKVEEEVEEAEVEEEEAEAAEEEAAEEEAEEEDADEEEEELELPSDMLDNM